MCAIVSLTSCCVALDALASLDGQYVITVLLALEKAFEYVCHADVWRAEIAAWDAQTEYVSWTQTHSLWWPRSRWRER